MNPPDVSHERRAGPGCSSSGRQMSLLGEGPSKHRIKTWGLFLLPPVTSNTWPEPQILPLLGSVGVTHELITLTHPHTPPPHTHHILPYPEGTGWIIYQKEAGRRKARAQDERSRRRRIADTGASSSVRLEVTSVAASLQEYLTPCGRATQERSWGLVNLVNYILSTLGNLIFKGSLIEFFFFCKELFCGANKYQLPKLISFLTG